MKIRSLALSAALFLSSALSPALAASGSWPGPFLTPGTTYYTTGDCVSIDGGGNLIPSGGACNSEAGNLTIGTTTITGGTSGRVLYDNGGVLGEKATTGSGNAVLATSPTLTTPTVSGALGVSGTAPTPTGTGTPTIATGSTDTAGEVTAGASATSVVITFAGTYTNAPFCAVHSQAQITSFAYALSASAITITQTATSGNKIDYICAFTG